MSNKHVWVPKMKPLHGFNEFGTRLLTTSTMQKCVTNALMNLSPLCFSILVLLYREIMRMLTSVHVHRVNLQVIVCIEYYC